MASPPNSTNITPPRVPLIDARTGLISREWYRFFLNLFTLTGSGTNITSLTDLQLGPPSLPIELAQNDPSAPTNGPSDSALTSQIAELQKQINALEEAPQTVELQKQTDDYMLLPACCSQQVKQDIYGGFQNNTDELAATATSAQIVYFDTVDLASRVTLENETAVFTASTAATAMTVSAVTSGSIYIGMTVTGTGVAAGTKITAFVSGTYGGAGVYTISVSQTLTSRTMTGSFASRITVYAPGVYNLQFSAQFVNTDSAAHDINIWLQKNGTNVAESNSYATIPSKHGGVNGNALVALNFFVQMNAGDYVSLAWWASDTTVSMGFIAPTTSPTRPASPAIITTISCVSGPTTQ